MEKKRVPPALAKLARGRDLITTREFAFVTNVEQQTVRKNLSSHGHCFGIKPTKIGNKNNFPVAETALLLQGEQK